MIRHQLIERTDNHHIQVKKEISFRCKARREQGEFAPPSRPVHDRAHALDTRDIPIGDALKFMLKRQVFFHAGLEALNVVIRVLITPANRPDRQHDATQCRQIGLSR